MADYRRVEPEEYGAFLRLVSYAFRPEEPEPETGGPPEAATVGDRRGLFADGELRCAAVNHWFTLDVRGDPRPVAGLGGVATAPGHRRRGLVRELLSSALAEYRERSIDLTALWTFSYPFYRQFGWRICSRFVHTTCGPDALAFADDAPGPLVELGPDRWRDLERVYRAHNDRDLAMHRTESWWRKRVFRGWTKNPYVFGYERDGELRGYLTYTVEDSGDERELDVGELCAVDGRALSALLRFCRNHGSQVETVRFYRAPDAGLLDRSNSPASLDVSLRPGPMVRLVDVERALATLPYPEGVEATVTVGVEDGLAPWNDDTFRLSVADGTAAVERVGAAPDVEAGVGPLTQAAVGYRPVPELRAAGALEADGDATETLDALFPPRETFLREIF
jgi:predicted acetyltransferase